MPSDESTALDDIRTIKARFYDRYLNQEEIVPTDLLEGDMDAAQCLATLRDDGSWPDLAYADTSMPGFRAFPHLTRLALLTRAYRQPAHPFFNDPQIAVKIHAAINYWLTADPRTDHEWFNVIGIQRVWMKVAILLEDELTPSQKEAILAILRRPNKNGVLYFGPHPSTGQNLTWMASAMLAAGCLAEDATEVEYFSRLALGEIRLTTEEGIQVDGSFQQHGPLLYSGGYGHNFSRDNAELLLMLGSTRFAAKPEQTEYLSRHILDGQRWMIRRINYDFGVIGREIARAGKSPQTLTSALDDMAQLNTPRCYEFEALAAQLHGTGEATQLHGNKHFWRSDFMAHHRPGYYTSSRMCSTRVSGNESGNGEGIYNYHLGDGAFCLMKHGREYADLFPFWDWKRIPGVTCAYDDTPLPRNNFGHGAQGATDFAGGVSDGTYGLTAFDFAKDGVTARVSRFFFDDEIICLGAGISAQKPVTTSINQCRARDEVTRGENWILHDGVGYLLLTGSRFEATIETRTACWRDISVDNGSPELAEEEVFSLWLDHGTQPRDVTFSYIVFPDTDAMKLEETAKTLDVLILGNSPDLQAIWHPVLELLGAVFYESGSLTWPAGTLETKSPCALFWQSGELWVSDPSQKLTELSLCLNGNKLRIELPRDEFAGQSLKVTI